MFIGKIKRFYVVCTCKNKRKMTNKNLNYGKNWANKKSKLRETERDKKLF